MLIDSFRRLLRQSAHLAGLLAGLLSFAEPASAASWPVPLAGNAFLTSSSGGTADAIGRPDRMRWQDPASVVSIFFRVDRPASLDLALVFGAAMLANANQTSLFDMGANP